MHQRKITGVSAPPGGHFVEITAGTPNNSASKNATVVAHSMEDLEQWRLELMRREQAIAAREALMAAREERSVAEPNPDSDVVVIEERQDTSLAAYIRELKFVRSMVFGGLDGLTTTMTLICSTGSPRQSTFTSTAIFSLGLANVIADAFSMGMGDFLSCMAERHISGTTTADAIRNGIVMFLSFALFGFVPLCAYTPMAPSWNHQTRFNLACVLGGLALVLLGAGKGHVAGECTQLTHYVRKGGVMLLMGSMASLLSFVTASYLEAGQV